MSREILGHVTCPHCGNSKATVHRQAKGSKALYYRCYESEHGDCGTVQIILAGGQKWIKNNMRPLNKVEQQVVAEQAALDAKQSQQKAAEKVEKQQPEKKKKGLFSVFAEDSIA